MGSLWVGCTGLKTYAEGLGVVGNNLANVNTVGYKKADILYEDLMSKETVSSSASGQIGMGVAVKDVMVNVQVGGMETTNEATDIAITGEHGFFTVKNDEDELFYTRAGNFRFDKEGALVDPNGFVLQGWAVDREAVQEAERGGGMTEVPITGPITDIQLDSLEIDGLATSSVTVVTNLDSQTKIGALDATDPYFTQFKSYEYDSSNPTATPVSNSDFSSTINVYDAQGQAHTLTVYYNKVAGASGEEYWEYTVVTDPAEDGRSATASGAKAGVVMIGTITFDSYGVMENMTAFTLDSNASDPSDLSSWVPAAFDNNGTPTFSIQYLASNGSTVQDAQTISFDMGLSTTAGAWSSNMPSSASGVGTSAANIAGLDISSTENGYYSTTNYNASSYTQTISQDGYATGWLTSVSVDSEGVLSGDFTNGRTVELFVISLANFINPTDLHREGNNLFSATPASGEAEMGRANQGVFDSISGNTLETSNVDMASEMVAMITSQRAFQANSKVITTADAMMQKALELKR